MSSLSSRFIVITGIHGETEAVRAYQRLPGWHVIFVGDRKSIPIASSDTLTYLSIDDQRDLGFEYAALCPENHYSRKNIGYLYALSKGATNIFDTDDDNVPLKQWSCPEWTCSAQCGSPSGFANVYRYFTNAFVWPRGFPLDRVHDEVPAIAMSPATVGVWQCLADDEPDVDALHRLIFPGQIHFGAHDAFTLSPHTYCPFNSQATFWHPSAFPYLYLPANVSFRFTDILRGYIAQRLLWEQKQVLGFAPPTVKQDRNAHDLMSDLSLEVECYVKTHPLVAALEALRTGGDPYENMERTYATLSKADIVTDNEVRLCGAWLRDVRK